MSFMQSVYADLEQERAKNRELEQKLHRAIKIIAGLLDNRISKCQKCVVGIDLDALDRYIEKGDGPCPV